MATRRRHGRHGSSDATPRRRRWSPATLRPIYRVTGDNVGLVQAAGDGLGLAAILGSLRARGTVSAVELSGRRPGRRGVPRSLGADVLAPPVRDGQAPRLGRIERVAAGEHRLAAIEAGFPGRHVPAERVGQADDHVEERGDVDRVDHRRHGHARRRAHASASCGVSSSGRSVSFSRKPSIARRRSSTGAVRQSASTACQTSSPSAYDATAPWERVQKGHWLSDETKPANSSRSPADQSDGAAHRRVQRRRERPAEQLGPVVERLQDAGGGRHAARLSRSGRGSPPRPGACPGRRRRASSPRSSPNTCSRASLRRSPPRPQPTRSARRSRPPSARPPSALRRRRR